MCIDHHAFCRVAYAGGCQYSLAFNFDDTGTAVSIRAQSFLEAQVRDIHTTALGSLQDCFIRQRLNGFAIEFDIDVAFEAGFESLVPLVPHGNPVSDISTAIDRDAQKVLVFDPSRSLDDLYDQTVEALGDDGVASYSGLGFVEVAASFVTKAVALDGLAADLGVARSDVAVFGDNHNDIPMLEWAGASYAMANGTDDAKAAATEVIGSNDNDAVADKINELLSDY